MVKTTDQRNKSKHDFFFNKRKYSRETFKAKFEKIKEFDKTTIPVKDITNSLGFFKYEAEKSILDICIIYNKTYKYGWLAKQT